jgi:hypothetical protein
VDSAQGTCPAPALAQEQKDKSNMPRTNFISKEEAQPYATAADFCRVFADGLENLHLLSFLLTADETTAEVSFVSGIEDCVEANAVFRDWAHSWARRTIVQNAVRMSTPRRYAGTAGPVPGQTVCCRFGRTAEANARIASILELDAFERFVFVLSVLCRYTDQDCSVLLDCSRQDVREVRVLALQRLGESGRVSDVAESGFDSKGCWRSLASALL